MSDGLDLANVDFRLDLGGPAGATGGSGAGGGGAGGGGAGGGGGGGDGGGGGGGVPTTAGGVGLYQLGGSLSGCSHLNDGTYATVVGDWDDADLLAAVSGIGFVYTVTAASGPGPGFTVLDVADPQAYVDAVLAHKAIHGFKGVFLDNTDANIPGLAGALAYVSPRLHAGGVSFAGNLGNFVPGDPGSDDGTLWIDWAETVAPFLDFGMLENWQQFSGGPSLGNLRTELNDAWSGWQRCPGAALNGMAFMGASYGPPQPGTSPMARLYGRASMLLAAGVQPSAVFVFSTGNAGDPYDSTWTTTAPHPTVDQFAGTATLL